MRHIRESNMTYFQHAAYALRFAATLLWASVVVAYHGLFPTVWSHWEGRRLIIQAYRKLPHAPDKDH
jgi:hypothetical protein